jgi:hypothetical protein
MKKTTKILKTLYDHFVFAGANERQRELFIFLLARMSASENNLFLILKIQLLYIIYFSDWQQEQEQENPRKSSKILENPRQLCFVLFVFVCFVFCWRRASSASENYLFFCWRE